MWLPLVGLGSCGQLLSGYELSMAGFMASYRSMGSMRGQGLAYAQTSWVQIQSGTFKGCSSNLAN